MSLVIKARALAVAAVLACPAYAHAADLQMNFTGIASPGSQGSILVESTPMGSDTTFDGQPVTISLDIAGAPGSLFVNSFVATWSDQPQSLPFLVSQTGGPDRFDSTVDLTDTGGSISVTANNTYIAETDGDFALTFDFIFSTPHNPLSSFTDDELTGGGSFDDELIDLFNPAIGQYDPTSRGEFTLSSLSQTTVGVPEPAGWAIMLTGFGGLGAAMRARRPRRAIA